MLNKKKATPLHHRLSTPRAAGLAGVLAGVLLIISHALILVSVPAESAEGTASSQDLARIDLAFQLLPFAGIFFLWFMGVARDRLGRREDQFYATVNLGSGLLYLAMLFTASALGAGMFAASSVDKTALGENTYQLGNLLITQITSVYGLRMAAVFMISSATMWFRTQVMPSWLDLLTVLLALVLLVTITISAWLALIFPAWMVLVSSLILISKFRRKAQSSEEEAID